MHQIANGQNDGRVGGEVIIGLRAVSCGRRQPVLASTPAPPQNISYYYTVIGSAAEGNEDKVVLFTTYSAGTARRQSARLISNYDKTAPKLAALYSILFCNRLLLMS